MGQSQNLARELKETPANLMTPTIFCERATALFKDCPNVEIRIRDREWALEQKMGAFVSVSNGSAEPLKFLEIVYSGSNRNDDAPLALVGKGVTFDSGGISIKPSGDMAMMKGKKQLRRNIINQSRGYGWSCCRLIFLMGNRSNGARIKCCCCNATDREYAFWNCHQAWRFSNCRKWPYNRSRQYRFSIENLYTLTFMLDAEGRLILADAIYYTAKIFNPKALVELSTLTGAMDVALGEGERELDLL